MCELSAVLISMGSSFHHFGARIANQRVFADGNLGPPRSAGAASHLADAERSARAGVFNHVLDEGRARSIYSMVRKYHCLEVDSSSYRKPVK